MLSDILIRQRGAQVGVINISDHIRNSFVMVKLITMFQHFKTENEAIVNLRGGEGESE